MAVDLPLDHQGVCTLCKINPPDADVIFCSSCSSPWHMQCLHPPLRTAPLGGWSCADCDLTPNLKVVAIEDDKSLAEARKRQEIDAKLICSYCMRETDRPITTPCGHNFCLKCLQRWFAQGKKQCGKCRTAFGNKFISLAIRTAKISSGPRLIDPRNDNRPEESKGRRRLSLQQKPRRGEFGCGICKSVLESPLCTPCGHNFCKSCLVGAFAGQLDVPQRTGRSLRVQNFVKRCPVCRGDISEFLVNPQVNREMIKSLKSSSELPTDVTERSWDSKEEEGVCAPASKRLSSFGRQSEDGKGIRRWFSYRQVNDVTLESLNNDNRCYLKDGDGTFHLLVLSALKLKDNTVIVSYKFENFRNHGIKFTGSIAQAIIEARTFLSDLVFYSLGIWKPAPLFKNLSCARAWHAKKLVEERASTEKFYDPSAEVLGVLACFIPYSKKVPVSPTIESDCEYRSEDEETEGELFHDYTVFVKDPGYKLLKAGAGILEISYFRRGGQWKSISCVCDGVQ